MITYIKVLTRIVYVCDLNTSDLRFELVVI